MLAGWQTIVSLMIVAGAIALILRRISRWWLGPDLQSGGGSCGGCPSKNADVATSGRQLPLIELQMGKRDLNQMSD